MPRASLSFATPLLTCHFEAKRGLFFDSRRNSNRGQITRITSEAAPLSKLLHLTNGSSFDFEGFNLDQACIQGGHFKPTVFRPSASPICKKETGFLTSVVLNNSFISFS
ncbi:hypothetical protein AVEN_177796-1 [Araneus ventricosus]|uniref:Uncharacterized protein n=1 Tax=Araneus ventricosus TaxID=182803 RepID=A0A4Y2QQC6_ARAVE|nr:hypothetical protein AVEN_167018-1 [Araneus ventricosus]GBN65381.1 hypothetical protein AVEN_177796-1 [Araneus ventricosus]